MRQSRRQGRRVFDSAGHLPPVRASRARPARRAESRAGGVGGRTLVEDMGRA